MKPLNAPLKAEAVAASLRDAINAGQLKPGDRLREAHLARQLGVSQSPVREALVALEREGIVIKSKNRGSYVSGVDRTQFIEITTVRAVLEKHAFQLAAKHITIDHIEKLNKQVILMKAAARKGDIVKLGDADAEFHNIVYQLSGHNLLKETLSGLFQRMRLALSVANAMHSDNLIKIANSHSKLIRALQSGDSRQSGIVAREHVLDTLKQIID